MYLKSMHIFVGVDIGGSHIGGNTYYNIIFKKNALIIIIVSWYC